MDLFTSSDGTMAPLNTFLYKVQRWTTNCFSATPTGIPLVETCLPAGPLLISHRQRLVALSVICSPPHVNPVTARRHPSFPSLSAYQAQDSSRALTTGLKSVYLSLHRRTPQPVRPIRNHLPVGAVAHKTIPFTLGLCMMLMINSQLVSPALAIPPLALMDNTYSALTKSVSEALLDKWSRLFPTPGYYHHSPTLSPQPFIGLDKVIAGRIYQM